MDRTIVWPRAAFMCCGAGDGQPFPLAGDSGVVPGTAERQSQGRSRLLGPLDRQPPSAAAVAVLLIIAAAFAYMFLGHRLAFVLLREVMAGPEAAKLLSAHAFPHLPALHLISSILVAAIVGLIAGAAARPVKWLPGPLIVLATTCVMVVVALVYFGTGKPIYTGSSTFIRYQFDVTAMGALYVGAALLCAALGGVLSSEITRRVPVSLFTTGALAWIIVLVLSGLFRSWWFAHYANVTYSPSGWSLPDISRKAADVVPYLLSGAFVVWVLGQRSLWTSALILGALPAFQLLSGMLVMGGYGTPWVSALVLASRVLTPLASAAVGAWLIEAALSPRPRREILRHALAVIGIIIVAAGVGWCLLWAPGSAESLSMSAGVEPPVKDGNIVLLKKEDAIGVIMPTKQTMDPERISYDWYYRIDGGGTFRAQDAGKYQSGHVQRAKNVKFGPFSVFWSGHDDGSGYLYYDEFPGSSVAPDDVRICVTHERDLGQINAYDPRWVFKGSPTDPGTRLTAPAGADTAEPAIAPRENRPRRPS